MGIKSAAAGAIAFLLPKARGSSKAIAFTDTFNPGLAGNLLAVPGYLEHLDDIATDRATFDSRDLLSKLFITDPDVSAAVNAFLTVADTDMVAIVKDQDGNIDVDGHNIVQQMIVALTNRIDFTKGYTVVKDLKALNNDMRYMLLLRGGLGAELVLDKTLLPFQLNLLDAKTIFWHEDLPGQYKPRQRPAATGQIIELDIPTFFWTDFRQTPTNIYPYSPFVSAINTIAARQQVINDLYRIMQITGYPRLRVEVVEAVLLKNAPASVRQNTQLQRAYVDSVLADVASRFGAIRPDQPLVHTDSNVPSIMNEKGPGMGLDVTPIITVLNGQNQAALKTMSTIIGRGESGVNTASVEARIFAMNADALNNPVAAMWAQVLSFGLRVRGSQSICTVQFKKAELRPETELEPQFTQRASRLKADLSLGIISDEEYCLQMYGRLPLASAPVLSGTGFMVQAQTDPLTPPADEQGGQGGDSLARAVKTPGAAQSKSKSVQQNPKPKPKAA